MENFKSREEIIQSINAEKTVASQMDVVRIIESVNMVGDRIRNLPAYGDALSRINDRIDATQTGISDLETTAGGIKNDFASIRSGVEQIRESNPGIRENMGMANSRLESLEKKMEAQQADFQELQKAAVESRSAIEALPGKLAYPVAENDALRNDINRLLHQLDIPLKQEVLHHHHIWWGTWAAIGFFVTSAILTVCLVNSCNKLGDQAENDIKYRFLQVFNYPTLERGLQAADSHYLQDPGKMKKEVIREEQRLRELTAALQRNQENAEQIKKLQDEKDDKDDKDDKGAGR